jgi:hypothetical protein
MRNGQSRSEVHSPENRCAARRVLERLGQPSSTAGLAALLALLVPQLADYAPAIVDLALTVIGSASPSWRW